MRCPFCTSDDTKVLETRLNDNGNSVRRRRECAACSSRFSTKETVELELPRIIKNDNSREMFNEKKLYQGFVKALEKRPVTTSSIEEAIIRIKYKLTNNKETEVRSRLLGELVMEELKTLDEVAYIRFASVYRHFKDIEEFRKEIDNLIK